MYVSISIESLTFIKMIILEVNFTICPAEKRAASSLLHSVGRERRHPTDVDSAARLLRDARLQKQQVHQATTTNFKD